MTATFTGVLTENSLEQARAGGFSYGDDSVASPKSRHVSRCPMHAPRGVLLGRHTTGYASLVGLVIHAPGRRQTQRDLGDTTLARSSTPDTVRSGRWILDSAVDPAGRGCGRTRGRALGTSWVGVDGKGASGKTTLAAQIAAALPGSVIVHIDDFARPDVQWLGARPVRPAGGEAPACRATGPVSALGLRPEHRCRMAHRSDRGAGRRRREYRPPTYGWAFRGTSRSGSRCRTRSA